MYREQFSCHLAMFRAATHLFPHKSLYREQGWGGLSYRWGVQACSSCRDTPFTTQKSVSRTKWHVFPRFPARDTGFFHQKSVSQKENTYPKPKCHRGTWKLAIKSVSRIGTVPWLQKTIQSRNGDIWNTYSNDYLFTPYRFNEVDNKNGHPKPMSTVKQLSVL